MPVSLGKSIVISEFCSGDPPGPPGIVKLTRSSDIEGMEGENVLPVLLGDLPEGLYLLDIQSGTLREQNVWSYNNKRFIVFYGQPCASKPVRGCSGSGP